MSDQKETIYIDIDEEITGIIDKVVSSKKKVIAVVLPKRATVMQSIVNMRLLKRAAEDAGKSVVLITSEASVLPLAANVGMYIAKTPQSKPIIPVNDDGVGIAEDAIGDENITSDSDIDEIDETKTVGELSGETDEDAIDVDNDEISEDLGSQAAATEKPKKEKKDKKLKIPNFDSFRKKLFLIIGILIAVGVGWYFAFYVMPSAKITVKTDTTTTGVDITFTASPTAKTLDVDNKIVPATVKETKKTNTQKVPTTGEKNLGDKATGTVTMSTSTDCATPLTDVPAGTTVSSGNFNFITGKKAKFSASGFDGGKCSFTTNDVDVTAEKGGGSYNLSSRVYTVSGFPSVTANGGNMSGGTDKIIKIVSQQDVDNGKAKATEGSTDSIKAEITSELQKEGYVAVPETFTAGDQVVTSSPNVGDEANEVTVTVTTKYTMLGVDKDSLKKLVENEAKKQIDTSKQAITDDGFNNAVYQLFDRKPDGQTRMSVKTNVVAGSQLNADDLKKQIAGKRRGEIQQILNIPGVKDVDIKFSPFWVTKVPTNLNKITIVFEQDGNK